MSSFIITFFLLASIPLVVRQPVLGPPVYYWLVWMHPESQMYGGLNLRWTLILALTALGAWMSLGHKREMPTGAMPAILIIFVIWYMLSTWLVPGSNKGLATDFAKVILMSIVTASIMNTPTRVHALIWVIVICIGSVAIRTAGITALHPNMPFVIGPSFLGQSNEYARVLLYTFPLVLYLARHSAHAYVRLGMLGVAAGVALSIVGTNSRGGLVAFLAICGVMWLRGRRKGAIAAGLIILVVGGWLVLPEKRFDAFTGRMSTIENPEADDSFMQRVEIWEKTWDYVLTSPIIGGGAGFSERVIGRASHNSYVEVLGESGFVGLTLWFITAIAAFALSGRIRRLSRGIAELQWSYDLASYIQLSFVGYFVGGLIKNHGFFEFYYMLIGILMGTEIAVRKYLVSKAVPQDRGATAPAQHAIAASGN